MENKDDVDDEQILSRRTYIFGMKSLKFVRGETEYSHISILVDEYSAQTCARKVTQCMRALDSLTQKLQALNMEQKHLLLQTELWMYKKLA